ncbi:polymer-forming cytoskeletal protein [candidate division TA06 bacterium]|uniref:Polymer-forming cytoskeletal protein n=1 Tax=candidate division TA06 bacterium TaxID=2250710 RepID=A0A523USV0_UNCT6|nr:MAG: polymer-forming cytoskeletal protein [candidate division TA06 bacterium]
MRARKFRIAVFSTLFVLLTAVSLFGSHSQGHDIASVKAGPDTEETGSEMVVRSEDLVRMGESILVKENEIIDGDVVSIGGSITMKGMAKGDVVCIGGTLRISGTVEGDAVCIGGALILDSTAVVKGDVVSVFGSIQRHDDAVVKGESVSVGFGSWGSGFPWSATGGIGCFRSSPGFAFLAKLGRFLAVLVIVVLVVTFLAKPTDRLETATTKSFWRCFLTGLLGEVLIVPSIVLLAVSVVGIILIPFAIVALIVAFFFGLAGISLLVGNLFFSRFKSHKVHPVAASAMGVLLIYVLSLLAGLLGLVLIPAGIGVGVLGKIAIWVAWTTGLGAVILTRFGTRLPAVLNSEASSEVVETT